MQIYLSVTPGELQSSAVWPVGLSHAAYRIGPASTLLRQNLLLQTRGGLLSVSDREASVIDEPEQLCAAVLRECRRRAYTGVVLDFDLPPTADRRRFAGRLSAALPPAHLPLYVPEPYRTAAPEGIVLVGTAVSGGSIRQHLQEAIHTLGADRVALDLERLRMDFTLPSRTGLGVPLSADAFRELQDREQPAVFFSQDLCARYFTYLKGEETHFVLFDDAETIQKKLDLGRKLGCRAAFLTYPETADLLPKLFPSRRS